MPEPNDQREHRAMFAATGGTRMAIVMKAFAVSRTGLSGWCPMATVFGAQLECAPDATAAEWFVSTLRPFASSVGALVPPLFESYLRVANHPDRSDDTDAPHDIIETIADVAAAHTTATKAWFATWEGYGWLSTSSIFFPRTAGGLAGWRQRRAIRRLQSEEKQHRSRLADELSQLTILELPQRRYFLLTGPVAAASTLHSPWDQSTFLAPDLWWPNDAAWFVASDTDLAWLYVGGTTALTRELLAVLPDQTITVTPSAPIT
jgi:hypothetical protein